MHTATNLQWKAKDYYHCCFSFFFVVSTLFLESAKRQKKNWYHSWEWRRERIEQLCCFLFIIFLLFSALKQRKRGRKPSFPFYQKIAALLLQTWVVFFSCYFLGNTLLHSFSSTTINSKTLIQTENMGVEIFSRSPERFWASSTETAKELVYNNKERRRATSIAKCYQCVDWLAGPLFLLSFLWFLLPALLNTSVSLFLSFFFLFLCSLMLYC